jgi:hypothetical protein
VVDDARCRVVDEGEERREERWVGRARLVGRRQRSRDQLGVVEQTPRCGGELSEVLGLRVECVVERCRDRLRVTTTPSVTPDT